MLTQGMLIAAIATPLIIRLHLIGFSNTCIFLIFLSTVFSSSCGTIFLFGNKFLVIFDRNRTESRERLLRRTIGTHFN
jgi:uncharacterized membrane protein